MRADEDGTLAALTACRAVVDGLIAEHRGRIANTAGDSILAESPSVAGFPARSRSREQSQSKTSSSRRTARCGSGLVSISAM
jgi:class 3 adenylate cyclase